MSSERDRQAARDPAAPDYTIAARQDLAPLADLWVASWQATLPSIDFAARRAWFCGYLEAAEQRGGLTLCACDSGGCLAGFILLDLQRGVLEQIAVAPAHFGGGLAALLLDRAKSLSPAGLSLTVNVDNPRALRFYEKHGFVRSGQGVNPRSGLAIFEMRWPG